jgi:hypothetical protein
MAIKESVYDAASVTIVIVGHIVGAAISVAGIWAIEWLIRWFWGHEDPLLFDRLPLRYVFDAADLAIIGAFIFRGVRTLVRDDERS